MLALAVPYILICLATLTAFPLVWEDEPWYTQSAWSFVERGDFSLPMFGDLAGFDRENVVYGRSYLTAVAAAYGFGGVSPFTARLVSFISGLVVIAAVYGVGRELWDRRVGVLAAVLVAVAPNVVRQSHDARPEMMLVALCAAALYFVLSGSCLGSGWRLVVGGLLASLAADTHFNGLVVPIAIGVVLLVRRVTWRDLTLYAAGAIIGGVWWLYVHVLAEPSRLAEQSELFTRGFPGADLLVRPVWVFGTEVARYLFVEPAPSLLLLLAAVVSAVILLARRRDRSLLALLAFAGTVFTFLALLTGAKTPIYAVLLWPVAALLFARLVDAFPRPAAIGAAALVIVVSVAALGALFVQQRSADYDGYVERLRAEIPAGATVQAHPTVWFGFMDRPFYATHYFMFAGPYEAEVRRLGIEYVIVDELAVLPGCQVCRDSMPQEVRSFLADHAELVAEVRDPFYGRVPDPDGGGFVSRIYRVEG